jgi:flavin-dependent dehydrogenase
MIHPAIPSSRFDVIVIGARCAGAATAMLLARTGHRVLLVDRGRYGTDTVSTHALMRGAVVQLQRWNILPSVIAAGATPVRQATFFYGEEAMAVPIKPRDGVDALYAPRRDLLDRLLVDAANAAGADIVYGVRLKGVERSGNGRVTGAILEDQAGRRQHVSSRIVVGADGLRSTLARLVAAPAYRVGQSASATIYGHWTGLDVDGYGWYFVPGFTAAAIPANNGQTCVSVSLPATEFTRRFAHQSSTAFRAVLAQAAPDLAARLEHAAPSRLQGFPGHPGFFRQSYGPGWALVGDAGYFKDPSTSHASPTRSAMPTCSPAR